MRCRDHLPPQLRGDHQPHLHAQHGPRPMQTPHTTTPPQLPSDHPTPRPSRMPPRQHAKQWLPTSKPNCRRAPRHRSPETICNGLGKNGDMGKRRGGFFKQKRTTRRERFSLDPIVILRREDVRWAFASIKRTVVWLDPSKIGICYSSSCVRNGYSSPPIF